MYDVLFTNYVLAVNLKEEDFVDSVEKAKNQMVIDYINEKEVSRSSSCTIVDYPCSNSEEIERLSKKVLDIINEYKKIGYVKFSYQYFEKYKKARFIIMGDIECIQKVLAAINTKGI